MAKFKAGDILWGMKRYIFVLEVYTVAAYMTDMYRISNRGVIQNIRAGHLELWFDKVENTEEVKATLL